MLIFRLRRTGRLGDGYATRTVAGQCLAEICNLSVDSFFLASNPSIAAVITSAVSFYMSILSFVGDSGVDSLLLLIRWHHRWQRSTKAVPSGKMVSICR